MSGRKQHYIPQFVLRAFTAARNGTKCQVLVFRKARQPYLTATEGAAAERDFYSNPQADGQGALDDLITEFEGEHLSPILHELRTGQSVEIDPELASVAVAHLAFRTAHLRDAMMTMTDEALTQMKAILEDSDALRRFTGLDSEDSDASTSDVLRDELEKVIPESWPEKDRRALVRIVAFRFREKFDDLMAQSASFLRAGVDALESVRVNAVPRAHARALSTSLVPKERVEDLRKLNWRKVIANGENQHFVLPDCVVVARTAADDDLKPFALLSSAESILVVMPLSSQQLLVGSKDLAQFSTEEINLRLARCSLDFFVSSKQDEDTKMASEWIGTCAADQKFNLLEDSGEDQKGDITPVPRSLAPLKIRTPMGKAGDAMKRELSIIAAREADSGAIERIESIAVVASMSAGFEAIWNRPPTADELALNALGAVEPLRVGSDFKCRIILPRHVAEMLTQTSDPERRLLGTRLTKFCLGRVYYFDCWVRQVPALFENPNSDPWRRLVLQIVFRSASIYFGGLASARHEPDPLPDGDPLQEIAPVLRGTLAGLRETRLRFFEHRNVEQLALGVAPFIDLFLLQIASICGLLAAKDMVIAQDSQVGIVLTEAGLWEWHKVFSKDLRRHYERRHRWQSEAEFNQLGGHVERLLWTIGVFVSQTDAGPWMDVCDDNQLTLMTNVLRG